MEYIRQGDLHNAKTFFQRCADESVFDEETVKRLSRIINSSTEEKIVLSDLPIAQKISVIKHYIKSGNLKINEKKLAEEVLEDLMKQEP